MPCSNASLVSEFSHADLAASNVLRNVAVSSGAVSFLILASSKSMYNTWFPRHLSSPSWQHLAFSIAPPIMAIESFPLRVRPLGVCFLKKFSKSTFCCNICADHCMFLQWQSLQGC